MSVFALYLDEVGENRLKVMHIVKDACGLSFGDVKSLLESTRPRLMIGPKWRLESVQQQLHSQGARTTVSFYPKGLDTSRWAARISNDRIHCSICGAKLFFAVPEVTTKEQIIDFATNSKVANAEEVARTGWIHAGVYCPNGCVAVMAELDDIDMPE